MRVFADTSFYIALLSASDRYHEAALRWASAYEGIILTTEYVLIEVANYYCSRNRRDAFWTLWVSLRMDSESLVISSSPDLFANGVSLYRQRSDKDWSLTDCISFVVMKQYELADALTCDHHFEQAGFKVLLS